MLKDLFGGDAMVENVKIVPDKTYISLIFPKDVGLIFVS